MKRDSIVKVPAYRTLMSYIMPRRGDSAVFLEVEADVGKTQEFIKRFNEHSSGKITIFYVFLYSIFKGLVRHPELNRYIRGKRVYQRGEICIAFSMKVEKTVESPMREVKLRFDADMNFDSFIEYVRRSIEEARSGKELDADKKSEFFSKIPRLILMAAVKIVFALDFYGLLPQSFVRNDPFFSSVFVTNLGSIGIDAVFHHLYEYGDCPFFINIGKIYKKPVVREDNQIVIQETLPIRITFDERIADGFTASRGLLFMKDVIENPEKYIQ